MGCPVASSTDGNDRPDPLDAERLGHLFTQHQAHLRRMVAFRLDERVARRIDPSDVLQEAFLNARQRLHHLNADPQVSVLVWLRQVTEQTIVDLHRRHLGAQRRAVRREVILQRGVGQSTSLSLAAQLLGEASTPSQAALREERRTLLEQALDQMDPIDREVLALRHFEELSNSEVADLLGLQPTAASNRYVRALKHLKEIIATLPGLAPE